MTKRKLVLGVTAIALSTAAVSMTAIALAKKDYLVKSTQQEDYQNTLVFNASNMTSGSGSVTINGNTFNYTGITVSDNHLTFAAGSTLVFDGESGSSMSASGMVGGSFKSLTLTSIGACEFTFTLNGVTGLNAEAADGETITHYMNDPKFNAEITDGSFTTDALYLKYDCVAPETETKVLFLGHDELTNSTNHPIMGKYTSLMEGLNQTVTCMRPTTRTDKYSLSVLADSSTKSSKSMTNALNDNDFNTIVIQVSRRVTPSALDVIESELAALRAIKDQLLAETSDIIIYAPISGANPTIYTVPESGSIYTETANTEMKTQLEMVEFYDLFAARMARIVNGKVFRDGAALISYENSVSQPNNIGKEYTSACSLYGAIYNRAVPAGGIWNNECTAKAAKIIRNVAHKINVLGEDIISE